MPSSSLVKVGVEVEMGLRLMLRLVLRLRLGFMLTKVVENTF